MSGALALTLLRNIVIGYFLVGVVVCLFRPKIIRDHIATLKELELGAAGVLLKPIMALLAFLLACLVWPIAWFNAGKSEKKAQEAFDAQLERMRALQTVHDAMNPRVMYAGGDGSSFERAIILIGATLLSGPRAAYNYIERRYPGCQHGRQSLKEQNGKSYDVLEFTTADGEQRTMYFDISAQFQTSKVV